MHAHFEGSLPESLNRLLRRTPFPCGRRDLVQEARLHQASADVIHVLEHMPDLQYHSLAEVIHTFASGLPSSGQT